MKKQWTCKACGKNFYLYESGFFHNLFKHKQRGKIKYLLQFCLLTKCVKYLVRGWVGCLWLVTFPFWRLNKLFGDIYDSIHIF